VQRRKELVRKLRGGDKNRREQRRPNRSDGVKKLKRNRGKTSGGVEKLPRKKLLPRHGAKLKLKRKRKPSPRQALIHRREYIKSTCSCTSRSRPGRIISCSV
jgi:hypothetical protein